MSLAIEILFNLIEIGGSQAIYRIAKNPEAVSSLKTQFDKVLKKGYKKDDKWLRNEICVLLNFIVSDDISLPQFHEDYTKKDTVLSQMTLYAC